MSFLVKGFPEDRQLGLDDNDFPFHWLMGHITCRMNQTLQSLPEDKEQLLKILIKACKKGRERDEKRALRTILKVPHSVSLKRGNGLITVLSYTLSKRGNKTATTVRLDTLTPEQATSPVNADYNQEYVKQGALVYINGKSIDLIDNSVECDCVFSVEHKDKTDEPTVPCNACHGSGVKKCPRCKGSGRESYVDGYFASGEERIKTGNCPECGGSGRIPCPECNGDGVIRILSKKYSLLHSVKDTISKHASLHLYWPGENHPQSYQFYKNQERRIVESTNNNGDFSYVKKNKNSFLEDSRQEIEQLIAENGVCEQYHAIIEDEEIAMKRILSMKGDIVSRQEINYVFPAIRLSVTYGQKETIFYLYDKNGHVTVKSPRPNSMSFGEALKYRLLSLFKK